MTVNSAAPASESSTVSLPDKIYLHLDGFGFALAVPPRSRRRNTESPPAGLRYGDAAVISPSRSLCPLAARGNDLVDDNRTAASRLVRVNATAFLPKLGGSYPIIFGLNF